VVIGEGLSKMNVKSRQVTKAIDSCRQYLAAVLEFNPLFTCQTVKDASPLS
jgi:hypothetical protein